MRSRLSFLSLLFLGACGGGGPSSDSVDDPVAANVVAAAAEGTPAAIAAKADCGNLPDFVPVPEGAEIRTCVAGPDGQGRHVSGSIVYRIDQAPARILGWSRAQSDASGLKYRRSMPDRYEAGEQGKRSLMIVVHPVARGAEVTVNWGSGV